LQSVERFYPESRFGGFTDIDGTVAFYSRVNSAVGPEDVVLDFGCGRGAYGEDPVRFRRELRILKGRTRVIGVDVDPAGAGNLFVDEFRLLKPGAAWPVQDGEISLVLADCVIEHLPNPESFFAQARRVLRPGGHLCIRTPNVWSYIGIASRLIPNSLHARTLRRVQDGRKEEDVFPTLYRCNSVRRVRQAMARHGFDAVVYGYEAEPSYLSFSSIAYALGVLHQKLAPSRFRPAIFAFGRRREAAA
jgi:SAM-dependent methyltransferase